MRSAKTIQGLYDLCDVLERYMPIGTLTMVELGCYKGDSTRAWAEHFRTVHAVDPWCPGYDNQDKASKINGELIERDFDMNTRGYKNIIKHKQFSFDAAHNFENQSISFVYIDAEHTYSALSRDIKAWLEKVRSDGFAGGHDYKKKWPEVMKVVQDEFRASDWVFSDSSWIVELNPSRLRNVKALFNLVRRKIIPDAIN
jgi:hypothetical protein